MNHRHWKKHRRYGKPKHKPPWWPEGEPWPPRHHPGWKSGRPFFLRMAIGIFFVFLLATVACSTSVYLVTRLLGQTGPIDTSLIIRAAGLIVIVFIALSFLGWGLRRSTLPIDSMREASERIAEGDYDVCVGEHGPHEIRSVVRAFNSMAARLKQMDEQRRGMLADITHELKTPLSVIQGNLEGMLDGVYDRNDDRLETTLEETKYLVHLIDDLHLLSMVESGALKLNREPTDILPLIREIQRSLHGQAEEAGVTLSVEEHKDIPLAYVDPVRLREILINLHTNAIQHLPPGCSVTAQAYPIEGDRIQVEIEDDGPGMEPDQVQQAFLRFTKSSKSAGSGLGLSIVKSLVEAHGGEVGIGSEPGRGAKVWFTIPKA